MKKTFLTGLATFLPIAITFFIIVFIFDLITTPFVGVIKNLLTAYGFPLGKTYHGLSILVSRLLALVFLIAFIFLLGLLGQRFILAPLVKAVQALFNKIPLIKTIYQTMQEVTKNTLNKGSHSLFKGTALVPFPDRQTRAMALMSGPFPQTMLRPKEGHDPIKEGKELQSVFIPTSPHPISGFLVMYTKSDIQPIDVSTEDLFKFLLSCGTFEPGQSPHEQ